MRAARVRTSYYETCEGCGGQIRSDDPWLCRDCEPAAALTALVKILTQLEVAVAPTPTVRLCPFDDCLTFVGEGCPACLVRALPPPRCRCGQVLTDPAAKECGDCISTAREQQMRDWRRSNASENDDKQGPVGWVRRSNSLIWRPVYEQSEVA